LQPPIVRRRASEAGAMLSGGRCPKCTGNLYYES